MRYQGGFSLLEVMIAATVLSVGFSGLSLLSLQGIAATMAARQHSEAVLLASEIGVLMRLSPAGFSQWQAGWEQRVAASLPNGVAQVCLDGTPDDGSMAAPACDGNGPTVVKLFWREAGSGEQRLSWVPGP